jgi:hypothetical protein
MRSICLGNAHRVDRYLYTRVEGSDVPLEGAVAYARLSLEPNGDSLDGVSEILLVMGLPGHYVGVFDVDETNYALEDLIGKDVYEVVRTEDGSYQASARLRVKDIRFVSP